MPGENDAAFYVSNVCAVQGQIVFSCFSMDNQLLVND